MPSEIMQWLERHKIIFETVGVTALALIGVFIAAAQGFISNKQATIAEQQTEIQAKLARLQAPALIKVSTSNKEQLKNETERDRILRIFSGPQPSEHVKISVTNEGGELLDADINTLAFLVVAFGDGTDSTPVCGMAVEAEPTITESPLQQTEIMQVEYDLSGLVKDIRAYTGVTDDQFRSAQIELFLQVDYVDNSKVAASVQYMVAHDGKVVKLAKSQWEKVKSEYARMAKLGITYYGHQIRDIEELWRGEVQKKLDQCYTIGYSKEENTRKSNLYWMRFPYRATAH